jgi:phytoene dehydrogenase-like protein
LRRRQLRIERSGNRGAFDLNLCGVTIDGAPYSTGFLGRCRKPIHASPAMWLATVLDGRLPDFRPPLAAEGLPFRGYIETMSNSNHYDDLVIGSGMAGLTVASLLAKAGRRVAVLEAHDTTGGYAHTFQMGKFRFCAQVHYIFGCGEGEPIHRLLSRLGLVDTITFERLNPEGYDQVVVAGERHRIPTGLSKYRDRLAHRYPDAARPLHRYFKIIRSLREELALLPRNLGLRDVVTAPLRFPNLLRYRSWTLQRLYDSLNMPKRLQAVLAGQSGDYLLPPNQVSLLLHVALVSSYDRGAYYPTHHYSSLVDGLSNSIRDAAGSEVHLNTTVGEIETSGDRVIGVSTADGRRFTASRYISNADPASTYKLMQNKTFSPRARRRVSYDYSSSNFTLYLGIRDIDLRDHGFGNHNVWHYPDDDINEIYRRQAQDNDLSDPWLFLSTPTLHSSEPGLAPEGHQVLEVATSCSYEYFAKLKKSDPRAYTKAKVAVRNRILEVIEEHYIPNLRKNLAMKVPGTPTTNEFYVRAPKGNAYGSNLTPANMFPRVANTTPLDNLWMVNASAGYPSVGGTVGAGIRLYESLQGESVL